MKKNNLKFATGLIALIFLASCKPKNEEYAMIPNDVDTTCTVSQSEFNSWFVSGTAEENGAVKPANSVDFVHDNNCDFYKWSAQMFLWITSPEYGAGTTMESPVFYTVSPKEENNTRHLVPHKKGVLLRAMANVEKTRRINSEEGQATDDVLMDRNGNLVYYISMVNDVYAQFLTGVKDKKLNGSTFPTTAAQRDSIFAYAKANGVTLKDPNALAIELKTSWVVAESLKDAKDYVTIDAIIPTYTKSDTVWTIKGERKAKLALIGMHIVGSTSGHPEMVWATFEHHKNAPNAAYQYITTSKETKTVPAQGGKDWLLNTDAKDTAVNISHMKFYTDTVTNTAYIKNTPGYTISPSNTQKTKPWGVAYSGQPNAENPTAAASNTEILSINSSIQKLLPGNDVRKRYLLLGATWTDGGAGPDGTSYSPQNTQAGTAIGTSQLANSTMETYIQNGTGYNKNGTCFYCHSNNGGLEPGDLSHVFNAILPLPNRNKTPIK
jgi:hypothetical protein